jgi:hypothetical protein
VTAVVLVMLSVAVLLVAGYLLGLYRVRHEYARLAELRQIVQGEVVAMQQIGRINEAYFEARRQMRRDRPVRVPPAHRGRRTD